MTAQNQEALMGFVLALGAGIAAWQAYLQPSLGVLVFFLSLIYMRSHNG